MKKDPGVFIQHIIECIALIEEYTKGTSKDEFLGSRQLQDAVIRRIEIIGEAAKRIPREITSEYSDVPWKLLPACETFLCTSILAWICN
jgi:uncharacterized protein with HEPN domain